MAKEIKFNSDARELLKSGVGHLGWFQVFAVADLIGVGASAVIAVEHGKKNHQTANNIFTLPCSLEPSTCFISQF